MSPHNSENSLVSVLVPVFNQGGYLAGLLESVLAQSHEHVEVLIWDDASDDGTPDVVRRFAKDPRVRTFRNSNNRGLNPTWLLLLQEMKGQWWCCPGGDDILDKDFLSRRVALADTAQAEVIHGAVRIIDAEGMAIDWPEYDSQLRFLRDLASPISGENLVRLLLSHNFLIQPSALISTERTRTTLRHFGTRFCYAPDWYLWLLLALEGAVFAYDPTVSASYRRHKDSLSSQLGLEAVRHMELRLAPLLALAAMNRASTPFAGEYSVLAGLYAFRCLRHGISPTAFAARVAATSGVEAEIGLLDLARASFVLAVRRMFGARNPFGLPCRQFLPDRASHLPQ